MRVRRQDHGQIQRLRGIAAAKLSVTNNSSEEYVVELIYHRHHRPLALGGDVLLSLDAKIVDSRGAAAFTKKLGHGLARVRSRARASLVGLGRAVPGALARVSVGRVGRIAVDAFEPVAGTVSSPTVCGHTGRQQHLRGL